MGSTQSITLVMGGNRSGKSEIAEALAAAAEPPVTYLATAPTPDGADQAWAERIATHRARRPETWITIEVGRRLIDVLVESEGTVLVDSVGTWVATAPDFRADVDGLVRALCARQGRTIVVAEEVGLGVHPSTEVGGLFRDALGEANRAVAAVSDEVLLVVAGRVLRLDAGLPGTV
jgi:adenosyl cobinamide kinase/adenosyl cobinamide phosphate guanylyltransferase